MAALQASYEEYAAINGGNHCGICGREPPEVKLQRDHEHKGSGTARGLLCIACNYRLTERLTLEWMRSAIKYLERSSNA